MHNLLEIPIFILKNVIKLSVLRYLSICNVLYIYVWNIRAIPTYRVNQLYGKWPGYRGVLLLGAFKVWWVCLNASIDNIMRY